MTTGSDKQWPWDVLGIDSSADERAVRRAYAKQVKQQRPDEDADAFQRLRYAYESAMQMVSRNATVRVQVPAAASERAEPSAEVSIGAPAEISVEPSTALEQTTPDASAIDTLKPAAPRTTSAAPNAPVAPPTPPASPLSREPDAFESAVQLWQEFVARPAQHKSRRSLTDLFADVVNIPTREELEWQALCQCLNVDTPAELRIDLSAVLGWRDNAAHLRARNAPIANLALDRVFADEDYNTLRVRFTNAMALLEAPTPSIAIGAKSLLRAGVRAEMEQLLIALGRYHPNVIRLRLDREKVDFWGRCLKFRIDAGRLLGPALALNAWCGLLFAMASLSPSSSRSFDAWASPQFAVFLSTLMVALVSLAAGNVLVSDTQQQKLFALRSKGWLRYGWVPLWLVTTATALYEDGSGRSTSVAMVTLGVCTIWAALIHGWPSVRQLAIMALFNAAGLGFTGHWIASDPHAWPLPFTHGILFAFFLSFVQPEWRGWLARRPRLRWACLPLWFAAFAALIVLLLQREDRSTQLAWSVFTLMAALGGVLEKPRWNDLQIAIPSIFRGYAFMCWLVLAISKPDIVACVSAGLMSVWIIEGVRRRAGRG
nr:hypothetical protein HUO10_004234 [Paraburkholderia busanensis]